MLYWTLLLVFENLTSIPLPRAIADTWCLGKFSPFYLCSVGFVQSAQYSAWMWQRTEWSTSGSEPPLFCWLTVWVDPTAPGFLLEPEWWHPRRKGTLNWNLGSHLDTESSQELDAISTPHVSQWASLLCQFGLIQQPTACWALLQVFSSVSLSIFIAKLWNSPVYRCKIPTASMWQNHNFISCPAIYKCTIVDVDEAKWCEQNLPKVFGKSCCCVLQTIVLYLDRCLSDMWTLCTWKEFTPAHFLP
jgi:hypothetical protein